MEDTIMRRRDKIVVSIVGIFMVLLVLLGITYAYFLTRIHGNTNDKSVDIKTADLELTYNDGNGLLTKENIEPGDLIGEKTFTVTNTGTVTIDNYGVYVEEVINTFSIKDDVTYTLTCVSSVENKTCNGVETTTFPSLNERLVTNSIDKDEVQTYKIKVEYAETGTDQSIDMNKRLEARIQIYNEKDVVYLEGNVTGHSDGDYVVVESTPKKSQIVDGMYRVVGLKPGNHTIKVIGSDSSERGTKSFSVVKGKEEGISGDVVTINETSDYIIMDIDSISTTLDTNLVEVSDGSKKTLRKGTLAYEIYNNAVNSNGSDGRTVFREIPLTTPADQISSTTSYKQNEVKESKIASTISVNSTYQASTWYYYSGYTIDSNTGKFTFNNEGRCTYSSCYSNLVGKYMNASYVSGNTSSNLTIKKDIIYKVISATADSLKVVSIVAKPNEAERVLSITEDDYGLSYYFRGDVEDNYLTFNNMCWRVVRIEGDGSAKITLESTSPCNKDMQRNIDGNIGKVMWGYTQEKVTNSAGNLSTSSRLVGDYLNESTYKSMKKSLENWYTTNLASKQKLLKDDEWCLDNFEKIYSINGDLQTNTRFDLMFEEPNSTANSIKFTYDSGKRLYGYGDTRNATLKCSGSKFNSYIATLNSDEVAFAGGRVQSGNRNFFLVNQNYSWWLLSLSYYIPPQDNAFRLQGNGYFDCIYLNNGYLVTRPTITLAANVKLKNGDGTLETPYNIFE